MAHQNTDSTSATSQNAATDRTLPNDMARDEHRSARPEPKSYAAKDVRDATLAGPAAGEVGDYGDLGEPSGGIQQGGDHANRGHHTTDRHQGKKTQAAQREPHVTVLKALQEEAEQGGEG